MSAARFRGEGTANSGERAPACTVIDGCGKTTCTVPHPADDVACAIGGTAGIRGDGASDGFPDSPLCSVPLIHDQSLAHSSRRADGQPG